MAEINDLNKKESLTTIRNMVEDASKETIGKKQDTHQAQYNITDLMKILYLNGNTLEELEKLINKEYASEEIDIDYAKEISEYRTPIRIAKGKEVIYWELIDD